VGADRVFELARHLTERDREVALCLYDQQVLTTDQLTLLFFSSKRRAQDRLLFLYRQRVLDRFYPPSVFGAGKPHAHWLLDEAGAHLVAASLDLDRRHLDWQRRDDWGSHPQLAHRLEVNRFVTDLIAGTLGDPEFGVLAWCGPRQATARLGDRMRGMVRPDAELILATARGPIDLLLEWDRGTEPLERLDEKLRRYRKAEYKLHYEDDEPRRSLRPPGPTAAGEPSGVVHRSRSRRRLADRRHNSSRAGCRGRARLDLAAS
jgi:Replication-relaxation